MGNTAALHVGMWRSVRRVFRKEGRQVTHNRPPHPHAIKHIEEAVPKFRSCVRVEVAVLGCPS